MRCSGDACSVLNVEWSPIERVYVVINRSPRRLAVRFSSRGIRSELVLDAFAVRSLLTSVVDIPVEAVYLD